MLEAVLGDTVGTGGGGGGDSRRSPRRHSGPIDDRRLLGFSAEMWTTLMAWLGKERIIGGRRGRAPRRTDVVHAGSSFYEACCRALRAEEKKENGECTSTDIQSSSRTKDVIGDEAAAEPRSG